MHDRQPDTRCSAIDLPSSDRSMSIRQEQVRRDQIATAERELKLRQGALDRERKQQLYKNGGDYMVLITTAVILAILIWLI